MRPSRAGRASLSLGALLLLAGCPDPPPPPAPAVSPPPPAPVATERGLDGVDTEDGVDAVDTVDTEDDEPTLVTVMPPEPPGVGDRVRLGSGHLLSATPALRVGGAGVREGLAQLEVLIGPYCYSVEAAPGDVIAVGPAALAVDEVEATSPGVAVVRWERAAPADAPLALQAKPHASGLLLREQALFLLEDGARVGVGDVRETAGVPRVTLTIFPPDYEADPGVGYARDLRVGAGALVGVDGPGAKFRVAQVTARGAGQRWGTVVLAPP